MKNEESLLPDNIVHISIECWFQAPFSPVHGALFGSPESLAPGGGFDSRPFLL